jgi:hypothetical protein
MKSVLSGIPLTTQTQEDRWKKEESFSNVHDARTVVITLDNTTIRTKIGGGRSRLLLRLLDGGDDCPACIRTMIMPCFFIQVLVSDGTVGIRWLALIEY